MISLFMLRFSAAARLRSRARSWPGMLSTLSGLPSVDRLLAEGAIACRFRIMSLPCYRRPMRNLQVRNVPDSLHEWLRRCASEHRRTISDVVLAALEREVARQEWNARLATRPRTDPGVSAASLIEEERRLRDAEPE